MTEKTPGYAESLPYWRTSKSGADSWLEKAKTEIAKSGGKVLSTMYGDDHLGRAAYMIMFQFDRDIFKMTWPVLQSKSGDFKAAKVQAVTMMYHSVKSRAVEVRVRGARAAFFGDLVLSDGRTAAEASGEDFLQQLPALLPGASSQ